VVDSGPEGIVWSRHYPAGASQVPVRKLLLGAARDKVASPDAMVNPASLDFFVRLASQLNLKEQSAA